MRTAKTLSPLLQKGGQMKMLRTAKTTTRPLELRVVEMKRMLWKVKTTRLPQWRNRVQMKTQLREIFLL
jgi:hypothetical protein